MEEELREAIGKLTDQISNMNKQTGSRPGGSRGSTAPKADATASAMDKLKDGVQGTTSSLKKTAQSNEKLIQTSKKLNWEQRSQINGLKNFGKGLLDGSKKGKDSLDQLSGALTHSTGKVTKVLGAFAAGLGFAWGTLENFADAARGASGALNLGAVGVGLMQTQSMMSGLGKEFATVINESGGGFKLLGATTEDAVRNLSQMSRAVRNGSSMMGNLTKEFGVSAKAVDETAKLTAQLGLTEKDSASLMAASLDVARRSGATQETAMQTAIKSYAATAKTARGLSDQFGVSAKVIMQASMAFQKSIAGQRAAMLGVGTDATEIQGVMGQMLGNLSQDQRDRASAAMAAGEIGQAIAIATEGKSGAEASATADMIRMISEANTGKGDGTVLQALKGMENASMEQFASSRNFRDQNMNAAAGIGAAFKRLSDDADTSGKDAKKKAEEGQTTEASNIKSLTQMSTAVDYAKGSFWGLVAGGVGLLGSFVSLAAAGSAAAIAMGGGGLTGMLGGLSKGLNKITSGALGSVGKVGGAVSGATGGMLSKAKGFLGIGAGGASATQSVPGVPSTKGMQTAVGEVKSLGKMIQDTLSGIGNGIAKLARGIGSSLSSIGTGISKLAKGIGRSLSSLGKGIGDLGEGLGRGIGKLVESSLKGIGKGLAAVSNPKYFIGAAVLAATGGAMWVAGKAFQQFANINWGGVIAGGIALAAVTAGAALIGASGMVAPILLGAVAIGVLGAALIPFGFAAKLAGEGMVDLGRGLRIIGDVPIPKLLAIGPALALMGVGLAALSAAGAVSSLLGAFQDEGPIDKIVKIAKAAPGVELMAKSLRTFGINIMVFNKGLEGLSMTALDALEDFNDVASNISQSSVTAMADLAVATSLLGFNIKDIDWNQLVLPVDIGERYHNLAEGMVATAEAMDKMPKPGMWDTIVAGVGNLFGVNGGEQGSLTESVQKERTTTTTYSDGSVDTNIEMITVLKSIDGHMGKVTQNTKKEVTVTAPRFGS